MEQFFVTYLLPSGIFVAAIGYLFKFFQNYKTKKEDLRSKRLTLIEKLSTDFIKINNLFESLRNDAELNGYFNFKNITTIKPKVERIQAVTTDDLAVFEDNIKLKNEIVNIGDQLSSLLVDVNSLENIAQAQNNKDLEDSNKFKEELKKLRREVLKYGIQITSELNVIPPNNDYTDKHYNATLSTLAELRAILQTSQNEIFNVREAIKGRRVYYTIRCLDSQIQLRSLTSQLEDANEKYSKRNWLSKILIRFM